MTRHAGNATAGEAPRRGRRSAPARWLRAAPGLPAAAVAAALGLVHALGAAACQGPPSFVHHDPPDAAPDASAPTTTPDLIVDQARLAADIALHQALFLPDACELHPDEACIGGAGVRRLLRFAVETPNVGTGDLVLGTPGPDNERFVWSECHGHYHFSGYAAYELIDAAGAAVVRGRKQAFCLVDSDRYLDEPDVAGRARYSCAFQGIQRGWSDVYHSGLPCQFIDVTGVPDGEYTLRVRLNDGGALPELRTDNNEAELRVTLGDPALETPLEPCEGDARALEQPGRECGWREEGVLACPPGDRIRIGCAAACGVGACTGDPMLRVCDAGGLDPSCSFGASLGGADDACGSACPAVASMRCPASGSVAVLSAPRHPGQDYTCTPAVVPL